MNNAFERRVVVAPDVLVRDLDGETVLLNLNSELYFGLDPVGTAMWQALTLSDSIQAAYSILLAAYDVDPGQLRRDLAQLIESLIAHGLLVADDG